MLEDALNGMEPQPARYFPAGETQYVSYNTFKQEDVFSHGDVRSGAKVATYTCTHCRCFVQSDFWIKLLSKNVSAI